MYLYHHKSIDPNRRNKYYSGICSRKRGKNKDIRKDLEKSIEREKIGENDKKEE